MPQTCRWGILATGSIAKKFAQGLADAEGCELTAVGSRTKESAEAFGEEFGVPRRHGSYEALAADDEVDAIYLATPHPVHRDNALLCLDHGKAVLCEKPFTVNAGQAREVVNHARESGVFCMEAMWSRFFPLMGRLRELLADGAIGEVRMVQADFGFRSGWNPQSRLLDPALGGGGLLDVGVYPISLAFMVLGRSEGATGLAHIGETGVDEQAGMVLRHSEGRISVLATGVRTSTPHEAWILGTEGRIHIHAPWWRGSAMDLHRGDETETIEMPYRGNGYNYEAEEVARCLAAGELESDVMPLDETIAIVETMDQLRRQWGLKYPMEG